MDEESSMCTLCRESHTGSTLGCVSLTYIEINGKRTIRDDSIVINLGGGANDFVSRERVES